MAETSNISQIAELVSRDIFGVFNWERSRITNCNWKCTMPEKHHCTTHPSDAVWFYDEPYSNQRTYIQSDLKSYAAKSITPAALSTALVNLSKATECAKKSAPWQKKFMVDPGKPFSVVGMLFVYNHDGEYDKEFDVLFTDLAFNRTLPLSKTPRVIVLGPKQIWELFSIASHIKQLNYLEGKMVLSEPFYPECRRSQFRLRSFQSKAAATIDYLLAEVLSFRVKPVDYPGGYKALHVYYRGKGDTMEEFLHLIDYCFRYQQIDNAEEIVIHFSNIDATDRDTLFENFERARHEIKEAYGLSTEKLGSISCESLSFSRPGFCSTEIGMRD